MRVFDGAFLLAVSALLAWRLPFAGVLVLVLGLLIQFQLFRVRLLLGGDPVQIPAGRKIRGGALAIALSAGLVPLLEDPAGFTLPHAEYHHHLPLVVLVSLLSASMMVALTVEKRKR
jgi:hypothetical protein